MTIEQTTVLRIKCDNPTCPGNELDPADQAGWTFVVAETYGERGYPQLVVCSAGCLAAFTTAVAAGELDWAEPLPA